MRCAAPLPSESPPREVRGLKGNVVSATKARALWEAE
jgi:hypothetical protein